MVCSMAAANRDESVFDDAGEMDLRRSPNPHLAFGFGPHFCLGAQLARMEGRIAFTTLLRRFSSWRIDGDIRRLPSHFVRGVERLPLVLRA